MKTTAILAVLLALSVIGNAIQLFAAGGAKPKCDAKLATGQVADARETANDQARRDTVLDKAGTAATTKGRQAAAEARQDASDRRTVIRTVVVQGKCEAPKGLPDLRAATRAANASAGQ